MAAPIASTQLVEVNSSNHHEKLSLGLWNYFLCKKGVDLEMWHGGRSVRAHRLVLEVFLSPDELVHETAMMDSLLEFVYRGKITVPKDNLDHLLAVAKSIDFQILVEALEKKIENLNSSLIHSNDDIESTSALVPQPLTNANTVLRSDLPLDHEPGLTELVLEPPLPDAETNYNHGDWQSQVIKCEVVEDSIEFEDSVPSPPVPTTPVESYDDQHVNRNDDSMVHSTEDSLAGSSSSMPDHVGAPGQFQCGKCLTTFQHIRGLTLHLDETHFPLKQGDLPYWCSACGAKFDYLTQFQDHSQQCRKAWCGRCRKMIPASSGGLVAHQERCGGRKRPIPLTGYKEYWCDPCDTKRVAYQHHDQEDLHSHLVSDHPLDRATALDSAFNSSLNHSTADIESTNQLVPHPSANAISILQSNEPPILSEPVPEPPLPDARSDFSDDETDSIQEQRDWKSLVVTCDVVEDSIEFEDFVPSPSVPTTSVDVHDSKPQFELVPNQEKFNPTGPGTSDDPIVLWPESYRCGRCQATFKLITSLRAHLKTHYPLYEGDLPYWCGECTGKFDYFNQLYEHIRRSHWVWCQKCRCKKMGTNGGLAAHLERCPGRRNRKKRPPNGYKVYRCVPCNKIFGKRSVYNLHCRRVHRPESTSCQKYQCSFCPKAYEQFDSLKCHVDVYHPETLSVNYACNQCDKIFISVRRLHGHLKKEHDIRLKPVDETVSTDSKKSFDCDVCGRSFDSPADLNEHEKMYLGQMHYRCYSCDSIFVNQEDLHRHFVTEHPLNGGTS